MTAINLFKTADAAILLTDQAGMDGDRLAMIGSKVIAWPALQMAIAVNGSVSLYTRSIIKGWLQEQTSQAGAMGSLGEVLDKVRADALERGGKGSPPKLFIALWHPQNGPECYLIDEAIVSVRHCDSPPSQEPFWNHRQALIWRIEDQRHQATNIGGNAELTTVTQDGITSEIIHHWPDRLGEPITR